MHGTYNRPNLSTQVEVIVFGMTDNVVNNGSCTQQTEDKESKSTVTILF